MPRAGHSHSPETHNPHKLQVQRNVHDKYGAYTAGIPSDHICDIGRQSDEQWHKPHITQVRQKGQEEVVKAEAAAP